MNKHINYIKIVCLVILLFVLLYVLFNNNNNTENMETRKKIIVLQSDNRPTLDYLLKSKEVNQKYCNHIGYEYLFIELKNDQYGDIHPATKKIHIVNDFLQNYDCDILVFLDSDAWIQNIYWLDDIIINLLNNKNKQGCFSRDPYVKKNTFINSGSFILKNNTYTKQMYKNIIINLYNDPTYHHKFPYDQYYISSYVFENKDNFTIFIPDILNTPIGKVLRHNWPKNQNMYDDLYKLQNDDVYEKTNFIENEYYDDKEFPNVIENGYEYF